MRIQLIILTFLWLPFGGYAQKIPVDSVPETLGLEAALLMEQNKYEEAILLLDKASKLEPDNIIYPYETALAYYHLRNYKPAIKILEKLAIHPQTSSTIFQLLGNCYDNQGHSDEAMAVYDDGLKKFPEAGNLYLEKGIVKFTIKNYDEAIDLWEKGIEVDPSFASNYYWLGKIFAVTSEKIWAIMYGEMFMNIERNTARTVEMSRILYKVYTEAINQSLNEPEKVGFCNRRESDKGMFKPDFQYNFGTMMTLGIPEDLNNKGNGIGLGVINHLRQNFLTQWYNQKKNREYPNILFDFLNLLKEKGYLECYNYWFLMMGEEDEFGYWYKENRLKYLEFAEWFNKNPLVLDKATYFVRHQY